MTTAAAWSTGQWSMSSRADTALAAQQLGHPERQVDRLPGVQARVAHGFVTRVEVFVEDLLRAAQALGDIVAGELHVNSAGPRALRLVSAKEATDLVENPLEVARLAPGLRREGVGMHGIAGPDDRVIGGLHRSKQRTQPVFDFV